MLNIKKHKQKKMRNKNITNQKLAINSKPPLTHTQKIEQILRKIEQILPLKKNTTSKNNRLPQYKPLFNYPSKISLQNNTTPTPKKDLHHPNNQNKV